MRNESNPASVSKLRAERERRAKVDEMGRQIAERSCGLTWNMGLSFGKT
jgi:hypothetical protein